MASESENPTDEIELFWDKYTILPDYWDNRYVIVEHARCGREERIDSLYAVRVWAAEHEKSCPTNS